jgi:glycogen debranching enzyme
MREQIGIFNHTPEERDIHLRIDLDADFADLFEVKDALDKKGRLYRQVEGKTLVLGYEREGFKRQTRITVESGEGLTLSEDAIEFDVHLGPGGTWTAEMRVVPVAEGLTEESALASRSIEELEQPYQEWGKMAPRLRSDWRPLERAYDKSIEDLAALRLSLPNVSADIAIPAAGLPWFMSLFGRDSLITSYQALPFLPDLARSTLEILGDMQGRRVDAFRDEEPGKILHELRFGELTAF